jgi:hypothetical protein
MSLDSILLKRFSITVSSKILFLIRDNLIKKSPVFRRAFLIISESISFGSVGQEKRAVVEDFIPKFPRNTPNENIFINHCFFTSCCRFLKPFGAMIMLLSAGEVCVETYLLKLFHSSPKAVVYNPDEHSFL